MATLAPQREDCAKVRRGSITQPELQNDGPASKRGIRPTILNGPPPPPQPPTHTIGGGGGTVFTHHGTIFLYIYYDMYLYLYIYIYTYIHIYIYFETELRLPIHQPKSHVCKSVSLEAASLLAMACTWLTAWVSVSLARASIRRSAPRLQGTPAIRWNPTPFSSWKRSARRYEQVTLFLDT